MKTLFSPLLIAGAAAAAFPLILAVPAAAADAAHGQELFRAQCGVCHQGGEGDGDGGAGPSLRGVVGRKVGGDPNFGYTPALSDSKETWTADNLGTFLADPNKAKPGTSMPIAIKSDTERADVIAYLASLKAK